MKLAVGLVFAGASARDALAAVASGSAVDKVIQMLTNMEVSGKKALQKEQVAFAEFNQWCTSEQDGLRKSIAKGAEHIDRMTAQIGKLANEIGTLQEGIAQRTSDQTGFDANLASAKDQRKRDRKEFLEAEQDFSESVDAIERALAVLEEQNYNRPADAFLQVTSNQMSSKAKALVEAFSSLLQPMSDDVPQANAYEFQTGGVITMLKKLQDEFRAKLTQLQKDEMNSRHAFDMKQNDLTDASANAAKDVEEKSKQSSRKKAKKAQTERELQAVTTAKASDQTSLDDVSTECREKKLSFNEKQGLRAEELEALAKAKEIMSSDEVSGAADKHLSLAQTSHATSLLQTRGVHRRVRDFLLSEAARLHNANLAQLAESAGASPFDKVKKMINSLITRLMNEANEDAKHEGFCDTEMGKNKITRKKLSQDIESLNAAIEDGKSTILRLTESTKDLSQEVSSLIEAMGEATKIRNEEKERNKNTVDDAVAAQAAVSKAVAVLKEFYDKAGTATAFLQAPREWGSTEKVEMGSEEWKALGKPGAVIDKGHKEGMQTFGEAAMGQQDSARVGVLSLLEVILSDFARVESETTTGEAVAVKEHGEFMAESKKNQRVKEKNIEQNNADRQEAESKLATDKNDLRGTQDGLAAAQRVHEKLVPQCMDQGMTPEERAAARQAEINSLKEALTILNGQQP